MPTWPANEAIVTMWPCFLSIILGRNALVVYWSKKAEDYKYILKTNRAEKCVQLNSFQVSEIETKVKVLGKMLAVELSWENQLEAIFL